MGSPTVLRGTIRKEGAIELLRDIEGLRITGRLKFRSVSGDGEGEIALIGGEIAVDQAPFEDGRDPVDVFLALEGLTYEVVQQLPDLPVSRGTAIEKRGSLAVHVPVDLMSYCEMSGLTGVLELSHEGRKAEAFYQAGELTAIELDGSEIADLKEVFAWEQGRFRIRVDSAVHDRFSEVPDEVEHEVGETSSYKKKGESTSRFLHVVEMALTDVLNESERARSPTRTSPPLPPPAKRRPRPSSVPPPPKRERKDQTVRLIYLTGDAETESPAVSTRHAQKGGAEIAHIEARPERRSTEEPLPMAKKRKKKRPAKRAAKKQTPAPKTKPDRPEKPAKTAPDRPKKPAKTAPERPSAKAHAPAEEPPGARPILGTVLWAFGVMALGIVILAVLAQLPPVG